jgi:disulfide bond formation protein DsbB
MPDVDVATNFFVVLTFVADAIVALAIVAALAALVSPSARAAVASWARAVAPQSVTFAWIVATVATLGSLYYSERAGFVPCELCWYQRIVMYPLVIVLGVAVLRRDRAVWITTSVFVAIGAPLSLYHWLVERVPAFEESSSCSATAPCSAPWFEKLGFVTLAWMAMSAFLLIGVLMVCTLIGARDRPVDTTSTGTPSASERAMEEA